MAGLRAQIEATQKDMIDLAREAWRTLSAASRPAEADLAAEYDRFKRAVELLDGDVAAYQRANAGIAALERELIEQLRPLIAGKLCFVGYTATAVADMVTTPAYPRMPGVLVHSSVMNGFLQGQFRDWSPRWVQVLVILALGGLASLLAATRGPRESLVLLAGLVVFLILINGSVVFQRLDHWLELVSALIALLAAWAAIVVVRYLTVERARRRFSRAVAQYVSPAMARQISESAEEFDLSPVSGHVTCFFSDLAGFTRLSERLGPDGTRTVLNPYLEAMSAVLHRHNAMINKFIGDGIFAFFNPPILPCEGHERAACAAAIESQRALLELKAGHDHDPLADEFRRLAMRIGIGSGPVFVGDYGSENKLDYTCMGDTVNLASRLEGANKVFGTTIMVNGAARDSAGDEFVFRPLGALQVKGQTVAVRVYELLGYKGKINGRVLAFSERFEEAVQAFARRDWLEARRLFEACAELKPDDPGAAFYLATIRRYLESPPGEDWNGGVELTEK
jgi:adenylate cyclase